MLSIKVNSNMFVITKIERDKAAKNYYVTLRGLLWVYF